MKTTESQRIKMREYYKRNRESIRSKRKSYYIEHRDDICSKMRRVRKSRGHEISSRTKELHPLIYIHGAILQRCGIWKCKNKYVLDAYYGRGISICKEWIKLSSFESWCLSHGWKKGLQIDRIDNNKGYFPENCRFVTAKENSRNRRSNHIVEYNGEIKSVVEFVEQGATVLGYSATLRRLNLGWDVVSAFETPKCSNQYRKLSC